MTKAGKINQKGAKEYLDAHNLQDRLVSLSKDALHFDFSDTGPPPSMFYFEDSSSLLQEEKISLNIAFQTFGDTPVHILLTKDNNDNSPIMKSLFGDKSYNWVTSVFQGLERIKITTLTSLRSNYVLSKKLKFISILLNIISRRLYALFPSETKGLLKAILHCSVEAPSAPVILRTRSGHLLSSNLPEESQAFLLRKSSLFNPSIMKLLEYSVRVHPDCQTLKVGLPLLLSLWQVFECRALQWIHDPLLLSSLLSEQRDVIASIISCTHDNSDFDQCASLYAQRLQVTLFLYCDAVRFDESLLNPIDFQYLKLIGSKLEREHLALRDLSPERLKKDLELLKMGKVLSLNADYADGINNSFLLWLHLRKNLSLQTIISIMGNDCLILKQDYLKTFQMDISDIPDHPGFFTEGLDQASTLLRQYYNGI
jgi:hypothetical protein